MKLDIHELMDPELRKPLTGLQPEVSHTSAS